MGQHGFAHERGLTPYPLRQPLLLTTCGTGSDPFREQSRPTFKNLRKSGIICGTLTGVKSRAELGGFEMPLSSGILIGLFVALVGGVLYLATQHKKAAFVVIGLGAGVTLLTLVAVALAVNSGM
jgi:hypothetical protein